MRITNFSEKANLYRNIRRPVVDELFAQKNELLEKSNTVRKTNKGLARKYYKKAMQIDREARGTWRAIVQAAEKL